MGESRDLIGPPADTPEYMWGAWAGALHWAVGEPDIMAAFRSDTGIQWEPARTGIERAIDEATGADRRFVSAFIEWFNANVWGPIDNPSGITPSRGMVKAEPILFIDKRPRAVGT